MQKLSLLWLFLLTALAGCNQNLSGTYPCINVSVQYVENAAKISQAQIEHDIYDQLSIYIDDQISTELFNTTTNMININIIFPKRVSLDNKLYQVQNQVSLIIPRLPNELREQGINITKSTTGCTIKKP